MGRTISIGIGVLAQEMGQFIGLFSNPEYIRKAIYTTNAIEAVHRQFRKLTKTKGAFSNENSLLKLLYAGILNASKKWTMPIHNWNLTFTLLGGQPGPDSGSEAVQYPIVR